MIENVLRASARAQKVTGVPISTHTWAAGRSGEAQQAIFAQEGVDLRRVIIGHSGDSDDLGNLRGLTERGSTIGMDRVGLDNFLPTEKRVEVLARLCAEGDAGKMVLSHDANCWTDMLSEDEAPDAPALALHAHLGRHPAGPAQGRRHRGSDRPDARAQPPRDLRGLGTLRADPNVTRRGWARDDNGALRTTVAGVRNSESQGGWRMIRSCSARFAASAIAVLLVVVATGAVALAAELKVMSTVALNAAFDDLKPKFERATGHTITLVYSVIADLKKRIQDGETADLMFLSRGALDDLAAQGKVATGSIVNVARSSVSLAVREGVAKPDISTTDALKATLLAAKSVVYADPAKGGASGVHFAKVVEKLGITDAMKPKTVLVPGAQAAEVVSKGQAELGVAMASEIVPVAGAQLVGPLPADVGMTLIFSAGVGATNKDREAANALIRFITGPDGTNVLKAKGMDPM